LYDICVIGAGVTGTSIARELARYDKLKILLVEKAADVCWGTTKANSGVVHAGYAATPGTNKAKFNLLGNPMFAKLTEDLVVPFKQNGTYIVSLTDEGISELEVQQKKGEKNGVLTEIITDKEKIFKLEPELSKETTGILIAPTGGIVSPYELTTALAENATENGVDFKFNFEVSSINHGDYFTISSDRESIKTRGVINAAGLFADKIAKMVGIDDFTIHPRRGEYVLFEEGCIEINHVLFPLPTKTSKGILASPTIHGHPFLGPNAIDTDDKWDNDTTSLGINEIIEGGLRLLPNLPLRKSITQFAGLRAVSSTNDFIIGETKVQSFINAAGIQSPGLTSAPAIGVHLAELVAKLYDLKLKDNFNPYRTNPIIHFEQQSEAGREELIKKDPNYATVICRCELVTKAEVLDAIHRPLGATTLDGIKFRTRARMGRCGGGFCTFRIMNILEEELGLKPSEVTKKGATSQLVIGHTKDLRSGRSVQ